MILLVPIISIYALERQSLARSTNDSGLNTTTSKRRVRIRHSFQSPDFSRVTLTTKVIVISNRVSGIRAIKWLFTSSPDIGLHEDLSSLSCIDAIADSVVVVIEEMTSSETN